MEKELQKRILSSIILLPLSFFFIIKGSAFFILFLTILFVIASLEWFRMTKTIEYKIFGTLFLLFSFYTVYFFRDRDLLDFLLILIICVTTDIGGYIFGKIFKGPKLIKISPNKTYAGMIGSFLLSIITSYLFAIKYDYTFLQNQNLFEDFYFIFLVFIISSVSQIGDLTISYFKRLSKIKNTGNIFPGHGGLLDRIDGMIFAFPFIFVISKILL
jgi:phosphatidate cytidylyltransferase